MNIGLWGMELFSGNMGCVALTYSMIRILEEISGNINIPFKYICFVRNRHGNKTLLCESLGVDPNNLEIVTPYNLNRIDIRNIRFKYNALKCDCVIDLTQGDSFTDIYGYERFNIWTLEKEWVIKKNIPLILGPQTYGPFIDEKNEKRAARIVQAAKCVFTRDSISRDYIKEIAGKEIKLVTDVAFELPYSQRIINKKQIGLNVSALLWESGLENTESSFEMKTNYCVFIHKIIDYLLENGYQISLVPHVKEDEKVNEIIIDEYKNIEGIEMFSNPIEAKSYISGCSCFIGARMHATIAGYSSHVPTIATAYSRKFLGLFRDLSYDYVIDLQKSTTEESFNSFKCYFNNLNSTELTNNVNFVEDKMSLLKQELQNTIIDVKGYRE